ncbi:hypothetical protein [Paracoccus ravus]|uniref:hypothetical protein n=1 Tax=Paracoccus ravus TaxID=2447760 RepID=UPI00106E8188|nr:hypothetical protein [Paracoccus ravus]
MRGHLQLELRDESGGVIARRAVWNTVMQSGASIVAELFAGQGAPISHMGVGTSDLAPDDTAVTTLANEPVGESPALVGETLTPIVPASVTFETDSVKRHIRVRLRATLPAEAAVGRIREAGLISLAPDGVTARLYNRVTFAPIDKGDDHELSLFWEVAFPFGDLSFSF